MHPSSYLAALAFTGTALAIPSRVPPSASGAPSSGSADRYNNRGSNNNSETGWSGNGRQQGSWKPHDSWGSESGWGSQRQNRPGWGWRGDDNNNNNGQQGQDGQQQQESCMSREDAIKTAATFQSLIQGYTKEEALAALTPDFIDYSSAVSIIINRGGSGPEDVTAPIFTSRDEFMEGHGTQEPIPFETLKVWSTCDGVVSMVWRSIRSGQGQENESAAVPVTGVAVLETEPTELSTGEELERAQAGGYNYRIHTLWSEFNTAAWLVNNGVFEVEEDVPTIPPPEEETTPSPESNIVKRSAKVDKFNVGLA